MSTYWFFECLDHDPPLRSESEFTQHTDDVRFKAAIELAHRRPVTHDPSYFSLPSTMPTDERSRIYFADNATQFLVLHPTCRLGLLNEYGDRMDLP